MSERILNDNDFEGLKLYEDDALINQAVRPLMRKIVSRLFQGTEVNLDDFYFTIFEDKNANAFFIAKEHTEEEKKNIIAISRGLLDSCNNEAELAGIIGHECGHYLWKEILGGNNTIFQERAADLRAVDLLINGGYNPVNHMNICERLFNYYGKKRYERISLDVHGQSLARVEDIKARLTMIANEKGNFPPFSEEPDQEYLAIRKKAHQAYDKEGYDTYLEKCLIKTYGTKNINNLSTEQVLTLIYNELEAGHLESEARRAQVYDLTNRLHEEDRFVGKTQEVIDLCQKIFMKMHRETKFTWGEKHAEYNAELMLKHFGLRFFGDFAQQAKNIENFINSSSAEEALQHAHEMFELEWTLYYAHDIEGEWPGANPKGKDNIGKKLPKDQLAEWGKWAKYRYDESFQWAMHALKLIDNPLPEYHNQPYYSQPYYKKDKYFLDDNKIVIAYGDEAIRMNEEQESKDFLEACKKAKINFDKKIEFWDKLAQFSMATDEKEKKTLAAQLMKLLANYEDYWTKEKEERFDFFDLPLYAIDKNIKNLAYVRDPYIKDVYARFNFSLAKQYFCDGMDIDSKDIREETDSTVIRNKKHDIEKEIKNEDKLERALATLEDEKIYLDINSQTSLSRCREFRDKLCDSIMELAEYDTSPEKYISCASYLYDRIDSFIEQFSLMRMNDIKAIALEEKFKIASDKIQRKMLEAATRYENHACLFRSDNYSRYYPGSDSEAKKLSEIGKKCILEDFDHYRESKILKNVMTFYGFDYNADMESVIQSLDRLTGYTEKTSLYNETEEAETKQRNLNNHQEEKYEILRFWKESGILIATNAIRQGKDFNLKKMLKYIRNCSAVTSFDTPSEITDTFAKAIAKHNKFHSLPLKDKVYVYEIMNDMKLFSEKYANKAEFFKAIVKDIENHPDHNEAMEITEKLLSLQYAGRPLREHCLKSHDIEFLKEKETLIKFFAKGKADVLGIDDGSGVYYEKAVKIADDICAPIEVIEVLVKTPLGLIRNKFVLKKHEKFPKATQQAIMNEISTNIISQELTAQMLSEKGYAKFSQKDAENYDIGARAAENIISVLARSPKLAKASIDFLSQKCTQESIDKVFEALPKGDDLRRGIKINNTGMNIALDNFSLKLLHENFWYADLPVRAYLMNKILKAYSQKDEDVLDLVVDMHFDKESPYYLESKRVITTVFNHLEDYEKNLVLAALVSATQQDGEDTKTSGEAIGEGLKMFFENKGPAFVKFGQLLSYLPVLDADIRKPLAKLRDKADIPARAELFDLMKETLPNEELAKISRVGKILGAGSFFITAEIEYEEKPCVVALMRPHAKDLAQSGMNMIYETIDDLAKQNEMYKPLLNVANQARLSAMSETDIEADYAKYAEAVKIYDGIKIITPQGEYKPEVAKWISYGKSKDDQVYKIMSMAGGQAMTSSKMSEQTKHDMAVAYVTLELTNLLAGGKWDTDRHQGQQKLAENGFKKFVIGIFDTGAQMLNKPKFKDKVLLGELLYGMARAARNGESIADYMIRKVKAIDEVGNKYNFNTLYIDEVQRGLTALSDIITYQKEIKDENGKIIQPEKSLTSKEMGDIMSAVLDSGLVDKKVKGTIVAKAILNKIRIGRKGWFSSLSEGLKKISSSIKIEKSDKEELSFEARRIDKPKGEITELKAADKKSRMLGVSLRNIKQAKKENTPNYTKAAFTR